MLSKLFSFALVIITAAFSVEWLDVSSGTTLASPGGRARVERDFLLGFDRCSTLEDNCPPSSLEAHSVRHLDSSDASPRCRSFAMVPSFPPRMETLELFPKPVWSRDTRDKAALHVDSSGSVSPSHPRGHTHTQQSFWHDPETVVEAQGVEPHAQSLSAGVKRSLERESSAPVSISIDKRFKSQAHYPPVVPSVTGANIYRNQQGKRSAPSLSKQLISNDHIDSDIPHIITRRKDTMAISPQNTNSRRMVTIDKDGDLRYEVEFCDKLLSFYASASQYRAAGIILKKAQERLVSRNTTWFHLTEQEVSELVSKPAQGTSEATPVVRTRPDGPLFEKLFKLAVKAPFYLDSVIFTKRMSGELKAFFQALTELPVNNNLGFEPIHLLACSMGYIKILKTIVDDEPVCNTEKIRKQQDESFSFLLVLIKKALTFGVPVGTYERTALEIQNGQGVVDPLVSQETAKMFADKINQKSTLNLFALVWNAIEVYLKLKKVKNFQNTERACAPTIPERFKRFFNTLSELTHEQYFLRENQLSINFQESEL